MVLVFTETTSTLSAEYVSSFSSEKLAIALFRLGKDTGVECTEAQKSFSLTGDWISMIKAHNFLEEYFNKEVIEHVHKLKSEQVHKLKSPPNHVNGSISKDNTRGRKPGCTVDNSSYNQVPQPVLQYIDNEGQTLYHRSNPSVNETTDGSNNDAAAVIVKQNDNDNNHVETSANKSNNVDISSDPSNSDEVIQTDNTKATVNETIDIDKQTVPDVKTEFDFSLMDDDTDVDEQYINSSDIESSKHANNDNVKVKVEVVDGSFVDNEENTQKSKASRGRAKISKKKKASVKEKSKIKITGRKKRTSIKKPPAVPKEEKDEDFKCDQCDYIGKKKENLREHFKRMHRVKFTCEICKKTFGLQKDLLRHTRYVHSNPAYKCHLCDKSYKFIKTFNAHMETHDDNYVKPHFECKECHKTFSTKYVLKGHVKSEHLGIKKSFICPTCGRSFTQKNSYLMHANVHAGIKPYVCDVCGKAFSYEKSLKEHKYMHEEERRFECELCGKKFRQKTSLVMHKKVHKEAKDYMCTACGKGFTQKQALLRHERIHSGDKPFKCALCSRSFNDYSIIRRHMMMHHKRDKDPKTWRGDVICSLKRRSEFYIEGGPGYNHSDKLPMMTKTDNEPIHVSDHIKHNEPDIQHEESFTTPCNDNRTDATDTSSLYHVQDSEEASQAAAKLIKSDHPVPTATPLNYSLPVNFQPNVTIPSGISSSEDVVRQYQELLDYRNPSQGHEMFLQNTSTVPQLPGLTSNLTRGPIQMSGETTQGQTIPSPWGLPGYPPYYSPANFSHYQDHPN